VVLLSLLLSFGVMPTAWADDLRPVQADVVGDSQASINSGSQATAPEQAPSNAASAAEVATPVAPSAPAAKDDAVSSPAPAAPPAATPPAASSATAAPAAKSTAIAPAAAGSTVAPAAAGTITTVTASFNGKVMLLMTALDPNRKQMLDISSSSSASRALAILYSYYGGSSQRFRFEATSDGYCRIVNVNSGLVVTANGGTKAQPGAAIIQYKDSGKSNQRWAVKKLPNGNYLLVSKINSKYCIDVKGASKANGTGLVLGLYTKDKKSQQFLAKAIGATVADGTYVFRPKAGPSKYLEVASSSLANKASLDLYSRSTSKYNGWGQEFIVAYQPNSGYYKIAAAHSGKILSVAGGGTAAGSKVIQYTNGNKATQLWSITKASDGRYVLRLAYSGLALNANAIKGKYPNKTPVTIAKYTGKSNQLWSMQATSLLNNGSSSLSVSNGNRVEISGDRSANGSPAAIASRQDLLYQRLNITKVGNETYTVESMSSGLLLGVDPNGSGKLGFYRKTGDNTQKWKVYLAGNGYVRLYNLSAKKFLNTSNGSVAKGAAVGLAASNTKTNLKLSVATISPLPAGIYNFSCYSGSSMFLSNLNGATAAGNQLGIAANDGSLALHFNVTALSNGSYRIANIGSGMTLQTASSGVDGNGAAPVIQGEDLGNNARQQWYFQYASNGCFRIVSAISGKKSSLTVNNGSMKAGNSVDLMTVNSSNTAQLFRPVSQGKVTYLKMNMTLAKFTAWQNASVSLDGYYNSSGQKINPVDPNDNGDRMYQFMNIRGSSGLTAAQLNAYVDSQPNGKAGLLHNKGSVIVAACQKYGISEAYFLSHAILESGWGRWVLGDSANKGYTYNGKTKVPDANGNLRTFPAGTYYNFFGIGAVDASPLSGGRTLAIQNGWNSVDKALYGAAEWISEHYIYGYDLDGDSGGITYAAYPQPTLYHMKWDPARSNAVMQRGWHQYATDPTWARKIAFLMDELFTMSKVNPNVTFIVPLF